MARRNESSFFEDMVKAPWWISAILAVISYLGLRFLVPALLQDSAGMLNQALAKAAPSFAPIVSLVFVFTAVMSVIVGVIKKKKEEQKSLISKSAKTYRIR